MSNNAATIASASRNDILRLKKEELGSIARGHKRKVREYLQTAECDPSRHPLPVAQSTGTLSVEEQKFLDAADITKGRRFDESSIPPRRQLRSHTAKRAKLSTSTATNRLSPAFSTPSATSKAFTDVKSQDPSYHATGSILENHEQNGLPFYTENHGHAQPHNAIGIRGGSADTPEVILQNGLGKRVSRGSQASQTADGDGIDTVMEDVPDDVPLVNAKIPPKLPSKSPDRNTGLPNGESRHESPIKAPVPTLAERESAPEEVPMEQVVQRPSTEKNADRPEQIGFVEGKASHREERKEQEASSSISLQIPKVVAEAVSSPESTSGALSATTPAFHEASTDTSPDNEALQYDGNQHPPKSFEAHFPNERPGSIVSQEARREQGIDDRPTSADAQLQLDAEQAAAASSAKLQAAQTPECSQSTRKAEETGKDMDVKMMDLPKPQDKPSPKELPTPASTFDKTREIPDSQESQSPGLLVHQNVSQNTSREPRKSPDKQSKTPKEPSPATASSTSRRTSSIAPTEVMTTRLSSGAIPRRSVDEFCRDKELQTSSIPSNSNARKLSESHSSKSTSRASTPQTSLIRTHLEKAREKERSKLSTVTFAKQPNRRVSGELGPSPAKQSPQSDDYLRPWFEAQISDKLGNPSLQALLQASRKTISTADSNLPIEQTQVLKVLRRIQHLQQESKWAFRQPARAIEPNRPKTHRDLLMEEMQWMRTDFREEKKWKKTAARNMAHDCATYHIFGFGFKEDQARMKVKPRRPTRPWDEEELKLRKECFPGYPPIDHAPIKDVEMEDAHEPNDANDSNDHPTPDLIPSGEESSPADEFDDEDMDIRDIPPPTAMFTLSDDDIVFRLPISDSSQKLLDELPLYGNPLRVPQSDLPTSEDSPDAHWKRPILPLSKYTECQMVIVDEGPPRKKSRFDYEPEDDDDDDDGQHVRKTLPPENTDVALFNPENKHIRDRIHASHQFRPPSEFPMPVQSFFEQRESSQWTNDEEDELKRKVREYCYNWSMISSELQRGSARSCALFATAAERRTPWECFERWVFMEGLPQEMAKTAYFKAYTQRVSTAERNLQQQQAQAQQPGGAGGAAAAMKRPKRTAAAVRVERRRNMKHLHLFDSMRKNAKKKEATFAKQQQAATVQAARKQTEQAQAQVNAVPRATYTPQDLSRVKYERDMQLKERMERFQQQQAAARQNSIQAARQAQQNVQLTPQQQQQALMQQRSGGPNGANPPNPQNLAVPGQNRNPMQHPGAGLPAPLPNPNGLAPPVSMNGIPQAQMQNMQNMHNMQASLRGPGMPPSPAQLMQARQLSEQQRLIAAQQHAQGSGANGQGPNSNPNMNMQNSPPNMRGGSSNPNQAGGNPPMRPNFMGAMNNAGGISTPPAITGLPPPGLQQGSPRMRQPVMTQQQSQYLVALTNQIRMENPTATNEQVQQMVQQQIVLQRGIAGGAAATANRVYQNAMQAASGGSGSPNFSAGSPISGSMPNPISNTGNNANGNGDNHDGNINGNAMGNVGMMRGSLSGSSGLQPQMYASMLRQQQQQQQQLQQQMHAQQQGGGHGRNGSLSAQNQAGGQNGQGQNQQGQVIGNGVKG